MFKLQAEQFDVGAYTKFGSTLGKKMMDQTQRKWIYGKAGANNSPVMVQELSQGELSGGMKILTESQVLKIQEAGFGPGDSQRHFNNYSLLSLIRETSNDASRANLALKGTTDGGASKLESNLNSDLKLPKLEGLEDKKPVITKISATYKDGSMQADFFDSQLVSNATSIGELPLFDSVHQHKDSRSNSPLQRIAEDATPPPP